MQRQAFRQDHAKGAGVWKLSGGCSSSLAYRRDTSPVSRVSWFYLDPAGVPEKVRRAVLRAEPELSRAARGRVFVPRAFREDG
ncbi:hypothetical protein NDU88_002766 [Pleurodeles waltl]|uniref:Uncharacterized protein n=1 Tax=Pleurodeles waltl TaxID=8319 RepID=A0AAV7T3U4_PLEWA|nr:hypothetical protein NDU88_002766 [Pleurodeles waltl]